MLQDNPVRNLQYDSDLRVAQQPRVEQTLYTESNIITAQRPPNELSRISIPITNVANIASPGRTFIPRSGLDILYEMPSIHIEQTFELNEALTSLGSENRYTVRSPLGEALFSASESSTPSHRTIWGSARPFQMHLLDKTHQEALTLRKKMALGLLCCRPRSLEVWAPPGDLLGRIVEGLSPFSSDFDIENGCRDTVYKIKGPDTTGCCMSKEAHFKILTPDLQSLKSTISRVWVKELSQYTINVYFGDPDINVHSKALFLGAAFLLEYMYFQS